MIDEKCAVATALAKAKKRDAEKLDNVDDVKKLWGDKPQELVDANKTRQEKSFPSQVEELSHKHVIRKLRGINEDWRA